MNLENKNLTLLFLWTLAVALCLPVLLPGWRLLVFAPILVISYYQKNYLKSLWFSLGCGLIVDLLTFHERFGLHAANYTLTTLLLYGQRRNFFADSLSTLPLMTFFFATISTGLLWVLMYAFGNENVFSWELMLTDLLYMPSMDALYAFTCFILPFAVFGKRIRRGKEYFSSKN